MNRNQFIKSAGLLAGACFLPKIGVSNSPSGDNSITQQTKAIIAKAYGNRVSFVNEWIGGSMITAERCEELNAGRNLAYLPLAGIRWEFYKHRASYALAPYPNPPLIPESLLHPLRSQSPGDFIEPIISTESGQAINPEWVKAPLETNMVGGAGHASVFIEVYDKPFGDNGKVFRIFKFGCRVDDPMHFRVFKRQEFSLGLPED